MPVTVVPTVPTKSASGLPDWQYDAKGREIKVADASGLPTALVRELASSPEGYEASLGALQTSAQRILGELP